MRIRWLAAVAVLFAAPPARAYPWPLKPFHEPHPVRANFGDPRTVFRDPAPAGIFGPGSFSFHNGIDIAAAAGTPVYPVRDGFAHYVTPTSISVHTLGTDFVYTHIQAEVLEGQFVRAGRTVLGRVEAFAGHLHFTELDGGHPVNPLRRGHLAPYFDHTKPRVDELTFRRADRTELAPPYVLCGTVAVTAEAEDRPALPVPGAWAGLPVAPAQLSWSLQGATRAYAVRPRVAVSFMSRLPPNTRFWDVYQRGTFQNVARFGRQQFSRLHGHFVYLVTRALDTRRFPDGAYSFTVTAQDTRGNQGTSSAAVTVANASGCSG